MTRVVINPVLMQQLLNLTQPLELCDEQGHILARVEPILDPALWGPLEPQVSLEELDRRASSSEKRYTTSEVLEHLRGQPFLSGA